MGLLFYLASTRAGGLLVWHLVRSAVKDLSNYIIELSCITSCGFFCGSLCMLHVELWIRIMIDVVFRAFFLLQIFSFWILMKLAFCLLFHRSFSIHFCNNHVPSNETPSSAAKGGDSQGQNPLNCWQRKLSKKHIFHKPCLIPILVDVHHQPQCRPSHEKLQILESRRIRSKRSLWLPYQNFSRKHCPRSENT